MMVRVPASAPTVPPETGASTYWPPASATAAARRRVADTAVVPMSMTKESGPMAPSTPSSPPTTASTAGVSPTMTTTVLAWAATAPGVAAAIMPLAASASTTGRERLWTTNRAPAFFKFRLIGRPIRPSPMKPMVSPSSDVTATSGCGRRVG